MGSAFALVLHQPLTLVLNHGRWPQGRGWLCEAAFECYLPLLETAHRLVADGISPRWTINLSPVLTEQLASPEFQKELSFYYENVRRACLDSREHFERAGQKEIVRLTGFWEEFYERMWKMHRRRAARARRSPGLPAPRLRAAPDGAGRARLRRARDRGALALPALPRGVARGHGHGGRVLPRPEDDPPGLEPRARLPRRVRLPRVPQEALPRRPALLADHRPLGRPRPEAGLRPRRGRAEGGAPGAPLRRARPHHARRGGRERARRGLLAVRRRALRPLVGPGASLARARPARDGAARRPAPRPRRAAP